MGSRGFSNESQVRQYVLTLASRKLALEIVSGGAAGVDSWAASEAAVQGVPVKVFEADWDGLGKRAGFVRNEQIVDYADAVVCFWDGESKGTRHDIDLALKHRKRLQVFFPE